MRISNWYFGEQSKHNLIGVNLDLVRVVKTCLRIAYRDFSVIDGVRSLEQQEIYFETGKSKTMKSRHLTGHAVDLAVIVDGKIMWEPWEIYEDLAENMFQAAHLEGVVIEWGGHFCAVREGKIRAFRDGPHFQLPDYG